MAEAFIPVDPLNPGQVFACLGFVEAAQSLLGGAEGAFDWSQSNETRFHLRANGTHSPVEYVLDFLDRAEAVAEAVTGSPNIGAWKIAWGKAPRPIAADRGFPYPDPESPATLPCVLVDDDRRITIDHWGDDTVRDNVKFWAGAGGYPGAALARDALALVRGHVKAVAKDPFSFSTAQSSSFRLDWRRDYVPIDAGFSLNKHADIETRGYPLVELLAAVGLSNARPRRATKLDYRYAIAGRHGDGDTLWLPPMFLRAALGVAPLPFPMRRYRLLLAWPGQENQARAITTVTEET